MRRPVVVALLLLVASVSLSGCLSGGALVGEPTPSFTLETNEGVVDETTYEGRFLILDLMATWCGPCKLEVQHLREIQQRYGDKVAILSVGIDPGFDTEESLARFAEETGATWPHGVDRNGSIARAYKLGIVPKLVIVDPEGVVVFERHGEVLPAAMARVIDPTAAPEGTGMLTKSLAALGLGFLAAFNPYRRFHRERAGHSAEAWAFAGLVGLAVLAWVFSGFVSSRATYGSLLVGVLSVGAVLWWFRARRKPVKEPAESPLAAAAGDRAYEVAPHFAAVLVLGLSSTDALTFFTPVGAFIGGAVAALATRREMPEKGRTAIGLLGLALVGLGLLLFGSRILVASA